MKYVNVVSFLFFIIHRKMLFKGKFCFDFIFYKWFWIFSWNFVWFYFILELKNSQNIFSKNSTMTRRRSLALSLRQLHWQRRFNLRNILYWIMLVQRYVFCLCDIWEFKKRKNRSADERTNYSKKQYLWFGLKKI